MSSILNLKDYDIVFTTSFECTHGLSGHFYELIDYFYIFSVAGFNCCILLSDGTTKEVFLSSIKEKYDFSILENEWYEKNTLEYKSPKIINCSNICIVDGSCQIGSCTLYCENAFLLRCSQYDFSKFINSKTIKKVHLLQDFDVYEERFEQQNIFVVDYNKKILWEKYKKPQNEITNTALLYLTTNCRKKTPDDIQRIIEKYNFEKYLIVTNKPEIYEKLSSEKNKVRKGPIKNIFENFDTYIYTETEKKFDCSSRFIVECEVFNKKVLYEIDYFDIGLEVRKKHIKENLKNLHLNNDDFFINYFKKCIYEKEN